jgi:hypothetical protein
MPANLIEYEVVVAGPEIGSIQKALTERGRRGFSISHTRVNDDGVYTFIFFKDTGMHAEDDNAEWVDDGFVNDETSWT